MAGQLEPRAPRINVPREGEEARGRSEGKADQNESVGPVERAGAPVSELSDGPNPLPNGAFGPARYRLPPVEVQDKQGNTIVVSSIIREDR